jgi:hypothetical protein
MHHKQPPFAANHELSIPKYSIFSTPCCILFFGPTSSMLMNVHVPQVCTSPFACLLGMDNFFFPWP